MGVDFADYDNDGWPDAFVNALANQRYALFRNSKGSFDDVSDSVGISEITMPHSGWGTKMIDYDNDGWRDIFVPHPECGMVISLIPTESLTSSKFPLLRSEE